MSEGLSLTFFGEVEFDFEDEKKKLVDNLNRYKLMTVEEFTSRKKWEELQDVDIPEYGVIKYKIWTPTDLHNEELTVKEIQDLQPRVIVVGDAEDKTWNTLRRYCHSAEHHNTPGRFMKFLLVDAVSEKILGFASIASEMPALRERDELIGAKKSVWLAKGGEGTNNHSVQCPCIAATQPFGSNFLGGKLMATMLTTSVVRNGYRDKYKGDVLVGMTTTSLYGAESMYNGIKWWKGVGISAGKIYLQPSHEIYDRWHAWLQKNRRPEYLKKMTQKEGISGPVTSAKMRVINMIFKELGIKSSTYHHGYQRGCYYSCFYENGFEFLRGEIDETKLVMKPLFQADVTAVLEWWKPKAIKRYLKLKAENRLNGEKLFYNGVKGMTYEKSKEKFFGAVGR